MKTNRGKRDFKIIAVISDIHIGYRKISAEYMKEMLKSQFFDKLDKMKHLDAILVGGDISHSLLSLSSDYGRVYLWFIRKLYKTAKKRNCKVVILEGTPSHDMDHLSAIEYMEENEDGVDFRIYRKHEIIYLFEGYRMLVIPDKKVNKESKEYIESLLNEEVDIILGHGVFDTLSFWTQESENITDVTYHYPVKLMSEKCKGPILFGHVHTHTNIKNKVYYIGSFSMLERSKGFHGFLVVGIHNKTKQYVVEMERNTMSVNFHDISIDEKDLEKYEAMDIVHHIKDYMKEHNPNDLYTIRIKMKYVTADIDKVLVLDDAFRTLSNVTITKKIEEMEEEKVLSDTINKKKQRLRYLFDQSISLEEVIAKYYEEEVRPFNSKYEKVKINIEDIKRILGE